MASLLLSILYHPARKNASLPKKTRQISVAKTVICKTKIKKLSRIHRLRRHTIYATIELKDIEKGKTQMFSVRGP